MLLTMKPGSRSVLYVASITGLFCAIPAVAFSAEAERNAAVFPTRGELHAWHETLKVFPPITQGCFHASYPDLVWEEEACQPAAVHPKIASLARVKILAGQMNHGGIQRTEMVASSGKSTPLSGGSGSDYMAQTSNLTQSATGSFPSVTGVTSASSGNYSLQLNTNLGQGSSTVCNSLGGYPYCSLWEQFIYSTTGEDVSDTPPQAYIQDWLFIPSSYQCPSGWGSYAQEPGVTGCYMDSAPVSVSNVPLSDLASVDLSGSASTSGNDVVTFTYGTTAKAVSQPGTTLYIGSIWNQSEFNVVGDGGGSGIAFNSGSTLTVKLQVNDGGTDTPTCISQGETGESNNLTLGTCSATAPSTGTGPGSTTGNIVAASSGLCMSATSNSQLIQSKCGEKNNLQLTLVSVGSDYHIVAQGSGQCVSVPDPSFAPDIPLTLTGCNSNNALFDVVQVGNYYHIVSRSSGMCVNIQHNSNSEGALVIQWPCQSSTQTNDQFTVPNGTTAGSGPGYIEFTESN